MKKLLSLILAAFMCLSMMSTVFAAEMNFTDVTTSDWFYNDVEIAVELGLINGKSTTTYAPNDNLTYAEAIKLAACMHQLYTEGAVNFETAEPWYKPYVDYCMTKEIIDNEYNYNDNASRAGYMGIFAKALPDEALIEINTVPDNSIPDVPSSGTYAKPIYKLYRAGIVQGVDEAHNCDPLSYIKRSEVAAILTRMMNSDKRIEFSMSKPSSGGSGSGGSETVKPLAIKTQPVDTTVKVGETAELFVAVNGGKAPYSYQWQIEVVVGSSAGWFDLEETATSYSGQTTDTLYATLTAVSERAMRCVITDAKGNKVESEAMTLKFEEDEIPLEAKVNTASVTAQKGESVILSIVAGSGKAPYTYKWQIKATDDSWADISDNPYFSNSDTESLSVALDEKTVEEFRCIVTDSEGTTVTSSVITLTVDEIPQTEPLKIKTQPMAANGKIGEALTFVVEAEGGKEPYAYSWLWNNEGTWVELKKSPNCIGVNTNELIISPTAIGDVEICCVVTDANGDKVTSASAVLTGLADPISIATQPSNTTVKVGFPAKLEIVATGGKTPYTYQWELKTGSNWIKIADNAQITGATEATIILDATKAGTAQLRCTVTDANGDKVTSKIVSVEFK